MTRIANATTREYAEVAPRASDTSRRMMLYSVGVAVLALLLFSWWAVRGASTEPNLTVADPAPTASAELLDQLAVAAGAGPTVGTDQLAYTQVESLGSVARVVEPGNVLEAKVTSTAEFAVGLDGRGSQREVSRTLEYLSPEGEAAWNATGGPPTTSFAPAQVDLTTLLEGLLGRSRAEIADALQTRARSSDDPTYYLMHEISELFSVLPLSVEARQGALDAMSETGTIHAKSGIADVVGRVGVEISATNATGSRSYHMILNPIDASLLERKEYDVNDGVETLWSRSTYLERSVA